MTPEKEERCASDVNLYWSPIDFSKQTQGKLSRGMVNTKTELSQNIQKKEKIQFNLIACIFRLELWLFVIWAKELRCLL